MKKIEHMELDAHRAQISSDVQQLVEKYRSIFEWDVPDVDQDLSDKLILGAIRLALDKVEQALPGNLQARHQ